MRQLLLFVTDAVISPAGTGKGNYLIPLLSIYGNVSLDREGWFYSPLFSPGYLL